MIKPDDPTPDEWGVRSWCLLALKYKGLVNPLRCSEWHEGWRGRIPKQWMRSETISPWHPFYKDGFEQLAAAGIDFNQGILRPTKELVNLGWQPVLGWHSRNSA